LGCFAGPALAGAVSGFFTGPLTVEGALRLGILAAIIFPIGFLIAFIFGKKLWKKKPEIRHDLMKS